MENRTVQIRFCARCGGNHDNLTFKPFTRPHGNWTHWAPCPENGEPIMMQVIPDTADSGRDL